MPLISNSYRELNRRLHAESEVYGAKGQRWATWVYRLIETEKFTTFLDYGCGKGALRTAMLTTPEKHVVAEYDPAVAGKDGEPSPADLVVCADVLEHIEPEHLNSVLRHLASLTKKRLFFSISTREAYKTLDDGRNAHLIVKPESWWRAKLLEHFQIAFVGHGEDMIYGEAFPLPKNVLRMAAHKANDKRRPIGPHWQAMFRQLTSQSAKYNDRFSRIEHIRMWEGIDDELADMQVACNILEYIEDIDAAFSNIVHLSRKGVMITARLSPERSEAAWRTILERRLRISDWHHDPETQSLVAIGSPMVGVQGIKAFGAVADDERWTQVAEHIKQFSGRIAVAPAHERRALVCCYGPSLKAQIDIIKREAALPNVDVISVSGAHDFLIANGIVPTYHVECDPRPHKADNLDVSHPDVTYLIASVAHSKLLDKLPHDQVKLWHVSCAEHTIRLVDKEGESPDTLVSGGGSVGLRSITLLYALGYRDMYFFAMDCSFADDGKTQWAGKHAGKTQDIVEVDCGGRKFYSSPQLATYATNFFETIQKTDDVTYRLYGDGLLQAMCRYYQGVPEIDARVDQSAAA